MENVTIEPTIAQKHIGRIFLMASKVEAFNGHRIEQIEILPGGLTNDNFKVRIGGQHYAVRCAGEGTHKLINRPAEDNNAHRMAEEEINPELFYYDPVIGDKIDVYIDGKTLHVPDFQNPEADDYIRLIAGTLHQVHNGGKEFKGRFDFFEQVHNYIKLMEENNLENYPGHDRVMKKFRQIEGILERNPRRFTPTHNDPLPENWIVEGNRIYLIDWEYGGIGDPLMDIAAFSLEVGLSKAQEQLLITTYFDRPATDKEYAMILINKFVNDVLWYMWAPIQIFNGKPKDWYWNYGQGRFDRCVALMKSEEFNRYLGYLD
jgi:thiamine kinase-like enzyme